jgi:integration host factor subunit beta
MTKGGLVDELARACGLTKEASENAVATVFESITGALVKGERVELRGFGTFGIRRRRSRMGRNPRTDAGVSLPERKVPFFKMGKELRTRINARAAFGSTGEAMTAVGLEEGVRDVRGSAWSSEA